jgi:hypothetical protein
MTYLTGAVYSPPMPGLPFVVVIFDPDGKIRVTRAVSSAEAGQSVLTKIGQSLDELKIAEFITPGFLSDDDQSAKSI